MVLYFIFRLYGWFFLWMWLEMNGWFVYGYGWNCMDDLFMEVVGNEQVNVMANNGKEH